MITRAIVCILLDDLIITSERQSQPATAGKPLIIGGDPRQRGVVIAASSEATLCGVGIGMTTWEALRRCPRAILHPPHPPLYRSKAEAALTILSLYSDHIEHERLDRFYTSMDNVTDDLVADMQAQIAAQTGLSSSLGVAANKLVASLAAQVRAPGGRLLIPPGSEASFLHPLPLTWLVDNVTGERLKRLGIRTIGELAAIPEHLLVAHFGERGKAMLRHAQGKDRRAIHPTHQRTTLEAEHVFDRVVSDHEAVRRWLVYLCGQVGQDLRCRSLQARTLTVTIGHLDRPPTVLTIALPKATDLDRRLREAAMHLFQAWDGRHGVVSLGVEAGMCTGEAAFQLDLLAAQENTWVKEEEQERRLDRAKNGLNKRYGQGTVMAAMLLDDDILAAMGKPRRKG